MCNTINCIEHSTFIYKSPMEYPGGGTETPTMINLPKDLPDLKTWAAVLRTALENVQYKLALAWELKLSQARNFETIERIYGLKGLAYPNLFCDTCILHVLTIRIHRLQPEIWLVKTGPFRKNTYEWPVMSQLSFQLQQCTSWKAVNSCFRRYCTYLCGYFYLYILY